MNFKHERSKFEIFYDFRIALKEIEMKICKKMIFGSFWKNLILAVLTFEGYFRNYEKFVHFLEKAIFGKIVADFHSFKKNLRSPKTDFV